MNSHLFFFLVVCFIFVCQTFCGPYVLVHNRPLCGTQLVDTMAIVCNYQYNSPEKKSVNWRIEDPADYLDEYSSNDLAAPRFPWMYNDFNSIIPMRHQRQSGGIIEECCKKRCPMTVLKSFCSK